MEKTEQFLVLAEREMAEYSTQARKIEKLRQKYTFTATSAQRNSIRSELVSRINNNQLAPILQQNRFAIALPFLGVGGLGLLLGISMQQPLDFIASVVAFPLAFLIQKSGYEIETMNLVIQTIDDIDGKDLSQQST